MFWQNKLDKLPEIKNIRQLPYYGFQFFFQNIGPFAPAFWVLVSIRVISTCLKFATTLIIGDILTNITDLTVNRVFHFYLPLYLLFQILQELLDYFTRRYAEALPQTYSDYLRVRFYKTIITKPFFKLFNYSKEKLNLLIEQYIGNATAFVGECIWPLPAHFTKLMIICVILFIQKPIVLGLNLIYLTTFLFLAFLFAKKYALAEKEYTKRGLKNTPAIQSFFLNLNVVKQLFLLDFFQETFTKKTEDNWQAFREVRNVHAKRWLIQLNFFNFVYAITFFYGIYQVVIGALPLGFLVLIKWSYDNLWHILVHFIESFVQLIRQRENTKLIRKEFQDIIPEDSPPKLKLDKNWQILKLKNIGLQFTNPKGKKINIDIPEFTLHRGEKVGILGESGAGKSTLLQTLLNVTDYQGEYTLDDLDVRNKEFAYRDLSLVNNNDPFFNLSIKDNIYLGKKINQKRFQTLVTGLKIKNFIHDFEVIVGDKDTHFSAGQLQRLRLLRGLLNDSRIYLLDEAFNNLDEDNKGSIIKFVKQFLKNKTVVFVTHDKKELSLVDRVYRFTGNRLI